MNPSAEGPKPAENASMNSSPLVPPARPCEGNLSVGSTFGPYTITQFLGNGGFSHTYLGMDRQGNMVALKEPIFGGGGTYRIRLLEVSSNPQPHYLSPDETPSEAAFLRNSKPLIDYMDHFQCCDLIKMQHEILTRAKHPNLIKLAHPDLLELAGMPILALEYSPGHTLREYFRSANEHVDLNWFVEVAKTLSSLKNAGTLDAHRALKPEDIWIQTDGTVKILDPSPHPSAFNGTLITSPWYNPLAYWSSKADVMALGVMLYEHLTKILPFENLSTFFPRAYEQPKSDGYDLELSLFLSYPRARELRTGIAPALDGIIHHCLTFPAYGLEEFVNDLSAHIAATK